MIEKIKVYRDQNTVDIALQEFGSVEGLVPLANLNGLSITDDLPGTIDLETTEVIKADTRAFYKKKNKLVATGGNVNTAQDEGIEYWGIEIDFIVS